MFDKKTSEPQKNLETLAAIGATEKEAIVELKALIPDRAGSYDIKTQALADDRYLATCQYERQKDEKVTKTGTGAYRSPLALD